jgi:hypothetical protein
MNFMRNKGILFVTLAVVLCATTGAWASLTMIHDANEIYYANGTLVVESPALGGSTFTVGEISGDPIWEVIEKAWWDVDRNVTIISYTVGNDSFSDPITSLHVAKQGTLVSLSAPTGWTAVESADQIVWSTADAANGVPLFGTLDTMVATFAGLYDITYLPGAMADFADGTILSNPNWVVSTIVPAPGAFVLGVMGLGLLRWARRRLA